MIPPLVRVALLAVLFALPALPAAADFRLCNNTASRVGVAIGYRDKESWLTEGWWNVPARSCETILKGALASRYYYVYAVDYDQGGEWGGKSFLCTRDKEFTIRGFQDCMARGYDRTGFFEIDSAEQKSWTVQLSEQALNNARPKSAAPDASPAVTPAPGTPPAQAPAAPAPAAPEPKTQTAPVTPAPAPAAPAPPPPE